MSDSENTPGTRVDDRRRFDPDGTPREEESPAPVPPENGPQGSAEARAPKASAEEDALRSDLEAARRRVDDLARAIQALERDKEDFKKRLLRERERMIDVEKGHVIQTLLEAMDELDLSLLSADDSPLAQGVRMIRDNMLSRLGSLGVERVSLVGRTFDPNLAEAVDMEVTANPDDDQRVVQELRPAYRLKDRVVRPGRVKVSRYVQPAQA
ncbi:MAG TPA: nucleotide exchange factor GrpE [Myxococcaceae bacterium]|jgi:molecular chaperone GrpE|nr:nucleotide exchange factor GrpE [Myxococcaceae bacterium]